MLLGQGLLAQRPQVRRVLPEFVRRLLSAIQRHPKCGGELGQTLRVLQHEGGILHHRHQPGLVVHQHKLAIIGIKQQLGSLVRFGDKQAGNNQAPRATFRQCAGKGIIANPDPVR